MTIDDYKDEIIKRYLNGETALDISKVLPFHNSTISKRLHKWGVSRGQKSKKRLDAEDNIINDFKTGKYYCEDLSKKYGFDVHTIYNILDNANLPRTAPGIRSKCNINYFSEINTPNKAYILGFITADGAIVNNRLTIEVKSSDKEVIEFVQKELNPEAKISHSCYESKNQVASNGKTYNYKKDNVRVAFGTQQYGKDLFRYGIVQKKSLIIEKVPVELIPNNLLHFYFRGLFDGDGCAHKDGGISFYSGSESFIKSVQNILIENTGIQKLKVYHGATYFVSWHAKQDRQKIFDYLYKDLHSTYYYPRKYNRIKNSL